ncbi:MAG: hypothetical protein LBM98_06385 [Oscillospiraceae bacterium]|nr:hypothetical protein [Oscillospiraceae bacterium]
MPGGQLTYVTLPALDCRAGFTGTYRKLTAARNDGQGEAQPCPGALRRDGGRSYVRARRGEPPRRFAPPLPRGEFTGEGGFETRPYVAPATPVLTLVSDI